MRSEWHFNTIFDGVRCAASRVAGLLVLLPISAVVASAGAPTTLKGWVKMWDRFTDQTSPVSGVTVSIDGQTPTTTGSDGSYQFSGLNVGQRYTLTVNKTGWCFGLAKGFASCIVGPYGYTTQALLAGSNFADTFWGRDTSAGGERFSIHGVVRYSDGADVNGARVRLSEGTEQFTNAPGIFSLGEFEGNKPYTVRVEKDGYEFEKDTIVISNLDQDTSIEFVVSSAPKISISGVVVDANGTGVSGLPMHLEWESGFVEKQTGSDGSFGFADQQAGRSYELRPIGPDHTFEPEDLQWNLLEWSITDANFVATPLFTNRPPIVDGSEITGQPARLQPDEAYRLSASYVDPDGRADLDELYLRAIHPDRPITMMVDPLTGQFSAWAGDAGEEYVVIDSVDLMPITDGYRVDWTFRLLSRWPETDGGIQFAGMASDLAGESSGWNSDGSDVSYGFWYGRRFLERAKTLIEEQITNPYIEQYQTHQKKRILFFSVDVVPDTKTSNEGLLVVLLDLDDLLGISPEGKEGWVTIWLEAQIGFGLRLPGFSLLQRLLSPLDPVTMGLMTVKRRPEHFEDDPRRNLEVTAFEASTFFGKFTAFRKDRTSQDLLDFSADWETTLLSHSVLSVSTNLARAELSRAAVLAAFQRAFWSLPDGQNIEFKNVAYALAELLVTQTPPSIHYEVRNDILGLVEVRPFTAQDNPIEPFDAPHGFTRVDSPSPISPLVSGADAFLVHPADEVDGTTDSGLPFSIHWKTHPVEPRDYRLEVGAVPDGWEVCPAAYPDCAPGYLYLEPPVSHVTESEWRAETYHGSALNTAVVPFHLFSRERTFGVWRLQETLWIVFERAVPGGGPVISILSPTSESTFNTADPVVDLGGTYSDTEGFALISWTDDRGGFGYASLSEGTWSAEGLELAVGDTCFTVVVSDFNGNSGSDKITITRGQGNTPPEVTPLPDQSTQIGVDVAVQIVASDKDGDTLHYLATGLPGGLQVDPWSGLVSGAPTSTGTFPVNIEISDQKNLTGFSFVWTVLEEPNSGPTLLNPGPQTNVVGSVIELPVLADDLDGDQLEYSASNLPPGLRVR